MNAVRLGTIGDIPFSVSPWFALLAFYGASTMGQVALGGLWVLCLAVSIVVHELGHAMVARHFRLRPQILLHGFGGLCVHDRAERDRDDVLIILAGPLAGLALGFVFVAARMIVVRTAPGLLHEQPLLRFGLSWMIWINVFWSLVNLIPMWPLDGGQLFRLGMLRVSSPVRAERVTHAVGLTLALGAVGAALALGAGMFALLLGGLIAWENFRAMSGERSSGPIRSKARFTRELVARAKEALDREDWAEASRLCHQARAETQIPAGLLEQVWKILGVTTARMGRHSEAVSYLRRAPLDAEVAEEWLACLLTLDRQDDADELLRSDAWNKLGSRGEAIVERLGASA